MERKKFVSAFKINGVPILPPLINDEVRAMINDSRQKAIEVERRILQKRREAAAAAAAVATGNDLQDVKAEVAETSLDSEDKDDDDDPLKKPENNNEDLPPEIVINPTINDHVDCDQSEQTPPAGSPSVDEAPTINCEAPPEVIAEESHREDSVEPEIDQLNSSDTVTEGNNEPCDPEPIRRLCLTRTVTPTLDEMLPAAEDNQPQKTLVRCNTFDLQKPSFDLKMLQNMQHSTPVDRSKSLGGLDAGKMQLAEQMKKVALNERFSLNPVKGKNVTKACESTPTLCPKPMESSLPGAAAAPMSNLKPKAVESVPLKKVSKGKSKSRSGRSSSNCSTSSTFTVNLSAESISNVLSEHEKRMKELMKRQEEERMLLERKFREQTEELVALCAKSTIDGNPAVSVESNGPAGLKTSSTVSMLSLCDISFDSCPDTDTDAAYLTCNNNGTSDELLSGVDGPTATTIDTNGNGGSHGLPLQDSQQKVQHAATIITAYARGYLTRRLFQTSEVQSIKQTIVDILTFIVSSRNGQGDDLDASLRRNAFKHIAFCLDRLHDVFVNYTPQQRMQMIRRDRYLKRKEATRPRTN
ncbi:uncharacterized protein LOC126570886 [Anopheles aquasalis]|uniref:uncharacterized protein LOC126570886 n=1 Tax=Anopheles aquasalis TaxID=42839 RepID=UPI00215A5662|nr:uncharacterized protein LOC126570886 [Anopheles aquasalis]